MGADRPDADLLIDDVDAAEAEGTGREGSAPGEDPTPTPGLGVCPRPSGLAGAPPLTCRSRPR